MYIRGAIEQPLNGIALYCKVYIQSGAERDMCVCVYTRIYTRIQRQRIDFRGRGHESAPFKRNVHGGDEILIKKDSWPIV